MVHLNEVGKLPPFPLTSKTRVNFYMFSLSLDYSAVWLSYVVNRAQELERDILGVVVKKSLFTLVSSVLGRF